MLEYSRVRVQRLCVPVWCTYVRWYGVHACVFVLTYSGVFVLTYSGVFVRIFGCVEGQKCSSASVYMYTELRTPNHTCSFMHEKCFCSLVFSGDKCDFVCNSRDVVSQVLITVD
jgi:hypothetical protein